MSGITKAMIDLLEIYRNFSSRCTLTTVGLLCIFIRQSKDLRVWPALQLDGRGGRSSVRCRDLRGIPTPMRAGDDLEYLGNWLTENSWPERGAVWIAGGLTPLHSETLSHPLPQRPEAPDIDTRL